MRPDNCFYIFTAGTKIGNIGVEDVGDIWSDVGRVLDQRYDFRERFSSRVACLGQIGYSDCHFILGRSSLGLLPRRGLSLGVPRIGMG